MTARKECWYLVLDFFQGDQAKARRWFRTENPLLGMIRPRFMIQIGREGKLLAVIKHQLEGNSPTPVVIP